jgi:hypothetical protein
VCFPRNDLKPAIPLASPTPPALRHTSSMATAIKRTLCLEDDTWREEVIQVDLEEKEFARGAMRAAYRMQLHTNHGVEYYVAKRYIKPVENEEKVLPVLLQWPEKFFISVQVYKDDIKVQVISKMYSDQYNKYNMPKKVDFVVPFLMELKVSFCLFIKKKKKKKYYCRNRCTEW